MVRLLAGLLVLLATSNAIASPAAERSDRDRETQPRDVRIGPLVGLGFPRPFSIEAYGKIHEVLGAGVEYSLLPKMSILGTEASFRAVAADVRAFPLRGPFFIGVRFGRQWLDANATWNGYTETMNATTWFVNPRIGLLYTWSSGFSAGIDAGVQIPIAPTYERHGPATEMGLAQGTNANAAVASIANVLGNKVTPTVDLIRLGFLF
jgi:hypothetical protein